MSSVFYQTVMYLLFCCTWGTAFLAALINCENIYKAVCVSSISWSTFLFALVEGLNIFKAITSVNLMIAWGNIFNYRQRLLLEEKKFASDENYLS